MFCCEVVPLSETSAAISRGLDQEGAQRVASWWPGISLFERIHGPMSLIEQPGGALGPSPDLLSIVLGILRGWKWLITIPLLTMIAIWGGLKIVPSSYKSTAEILIV